MVHQLRAAVPGAAMLAMAAMLATPAACTSNTLDPALSVDVTPLPPALPFRESFPSRAPTALDVLFVVDNSRGMEPFLGMLPDAVGAFVAVLRAQPEGSPDLHAAVVTTDMGAGKITGGITECPNLPGGDDASFVTGPARTYVWAITEAEWVPGPSGTCKMCGPFVADSAAAPGTCPTTEDVLACIVQVEVGGCMFEQPLAAALRVLSRTDTGFIRPESQLAVVIITNEDDCSLSAESPLPDPTMSEWWGPLTSYRCNAFGHLCDGRPPPMRRSDLLNWPFYPRHCVSNESGYLIPIVETLQKLQATKPAASMVSLSVIAGPTTSESGSSLYSVVLDSTMAADAGHPGEEWPRVQPSCGITAGSADPAVRLQQLTELMGAQGRFASICGSSLVPQLEGAAHSVIAAMTRRCLSPGGIFSTVIEKLDGGDELTIPPCTALDGGSGACWYRDDAPECKSGTQLVVAGDLPPGIFELQ